VRGGLRATIRTAAALVVVAAGYLAVTLPPRSVPLSGAVPPTVAFGAYHIHTRRSDGTGTVEAVARAAARAGLQFVILTDHGDATRRPDPPAFRDGVLCIDAVEIGTDDGHLVALGLNGPAPYPLAGEGRDVLDDVHRLGGMGILAHPDSPNPRLRWRNWAIPYDGLEWLNADSEWRDDSIVHLTGTALRSLIRPAEAVASLFTRPARTLQRWDAVTRSRTVVGLAAVDAHARIGWDSAEEPRQRTLLAWPSYEAMFRALDQAVVLDHPFTGDATGDAARVLDAIRAGHTFSIVRAIAWPAALSFSATASGAPAAVMGDRLAEAAGPVTFQASVAQAPAARLVLIHGGTRLAVGQGSLQYTGPASPGAFRVEVYYPGVDLPWLVGNPIYLGPMGPAGAATPATGADAAVRAVLDLPAASGWTIEKDPSSTGQVQIEPDGQALRFAFALGGGRPAGQYAALSAAISGTQGFDRVQFAGRASRPMRVSVQVRLLGGREGQRWRRSVYLDQTSRPVVLRLEDFQPVGATTTQRPIVARVQSLLIVVDTVNTPPGAQGTVWLSNVALGIGDASGGAPPVRSGR
jgi:hypothetical protein